MIQAERIKQGKRRPRKYLRPISDLYVFQCNVKERHGARYVIASSKAHAVFPYFAEEDISGR